MDAQVRLSLDELRGELGSRVASLRIARKEVCHVYADDHGSGRKSRARREPIESYGVFESCIRYASVPGTLPAQLLGSHRHAAARANDEDVAMGGSELEEHSLKGPVAGYPWDVAPGQKVCNVLCLLPTPISPSVGVQPGVGERHADRDRNETRKPRDQPDDFRTGSR
jgi:hypothetical protein